MRDFTVTIEIDIDQMQDALSAAREGWESIRDLVTPVVRVEDHETGEVTQVDLEDSSTRVVTAARDEDHPAHVDCADGCELAVTHSGPCRRKPGGAEICTEDNHDEADDETDPWGKPSGLLAGLADAVRLL